MSPCPAYSVPSQLINMMPNRAYFVIHSSNIDKIDVNQQNGVIEPNKSVALTLTRQPFDIKTEVRRTSPVLL